MRLFIIRLLLITIFFLLIHFVAHQDWGAALIVAFILEYVFEPLVTSKI